MLVLPHSCFIHVPKTGGSWVKKAIIAAGIPAQEITRKGYTHIGVSECPQPGLFRFAFVRHPVSLYRSYWQYKMTCGWDSDNELDSVCQDALFVNFVAKVLQHFPGVYSASLDEFVGPVENPIEFVGKYENLESDLISALTQAGEAFNAGAIKELPPFNVSNKQKAPAVYPDVLREEVCKAESAVIERFYA